MKLSRAQKNRLLALAEKGVWAGPQTERELSLFGSLEDLGWAAREDVDTQMGGHWAPLYSRFRITNAGKRAAEDVVSGRDPIPGERIEAKVVEQFHVLTDLLKK